MTARRRALLALAGLLVPGAALAQLPKPVPAPPPPAAKPRPTTKPTGRKAEKPAGRPAPPPDRKPPAKAATGKPRADRARPAQAQGRAETEIASEPPPRGPVRAREDGPSLRPLDRELVRNWLLANPEWRSAGPPLPVGPGKALPPDLPRQPLPPGLAMLLPYFPGYRYAAIGPDLALYASGTDIVASILAGALAR